MPSSAPARSLRLLRQTRGSILPCYPAPQELAGVAEADTPRAGMFLWLKLLTVPDSGALRAQFKQEKVVVVPGEALTHRVLRGCYV